MSKFEKFGKVRVMDPNLFIKSAAYDFVEIKKMEKLAAIKVIRLPIHLMLIRENMSQNYLKGNNNLRQ